MGCRLVYLTVFHTNHCANLSDFDLRLTSLQHLHDFAGDSLLHNPHRVRSVGRGTVVDAVPDTGIIWLRWLGEAAGKVLSSYIDHERSIDRLIIHGTYSTVLSMVSCQSERAKGNVNSSMLGNIQCHEC